MRRLFFAALFVSCGFFLTNESTAQVAIDLGPRVGYDLGGDIDELFVGVDGRFAFDGVPVQFGAAFDYYFTEENLTVYQIGVNAFYEFLLDDMNFVPYAGAGIGITRVSYDVDNDFMQFSSSSSDTGINLIGGARFNAGNMRPFVQAQFTIGDLDIFSIGGGILFPISR